MPDGSDIRKQLEASARVKMRLAGSSVNSIGEAADLLIQTLKSDGKVLICGNGGSAADSQHFAAELAGRFLINRSALPAVALTTDTSILTAVGNDFGFDVVFQRQVEALGQKGDLLFCISTSGRSRNVLLAAEKAREMDLSVIALVGQEPGPIGQAADIVITIPSRDTPRIQEAHITVIHILCDLVERALFS